MQTSIIKYIKRIPRKTSWNVKPSILQRLGLKRVPHQLVFCTEEFADKVYFHDNKSKTYIKDHRTFSKREIKKYLNLQYQLYVSTTSKGYSPINEKMFLDKHWEQIQLAEEALDNKIYWKIKG